MTLAILAGPALVGVLRVTIGIGAGYASEAVPSRGYLGVGVACVVGGVAEIVCIGSPAAGLWCVALALSLSLAFLGRALVHGARAFPLIAPMAQAVSRVAEEERRRSREVCRADAEVDQRRAVQWGRLGTAPHDQYPGRA